MMKRRLSFVVAVLCLLCSQMVKAQSATQISGAIKDVDNKPLAGATVLLKGLPDSVLIRSLLSDDGGSFMFSNIRKGKYFLVMCFLMWEMRFNYSGILFRSITK